MSRQPRKTKYRTLRRAIVSDDAVHAARAERRWLYDVRECPYCGLRCMGEKQLKHHTRKGCRFEWDRKRPELGAPAKGSLIHALIERERLRRR